MTNDVKVLCVDDEPNVLKALERLFLDEDFALFTASSGEEGLEFLAAEAEVQVVVSDYRMPGMNGVDFLKEVCERWPETVRIVLSGYADTAAVVAAINEGQIYKFIPKPWNDDELKITLVKAIELYFLQEENKSLTEELQASNEELQILNENLERRVQERTQELLFQNRVLQRSQFILDALPIGVLGLTTEGDIVQCNALATRIVTKSGTPPVGKAARDVLPPELLAFTGGVTVGSGAQQDVVRINDQAVRVKGVFMAAEEQEGILLVLEPGQ